MSEGAAARRPPAPMPTLTPRGALHGLAVLMSGAAAAALLATLLTGSWPVCLVSPFVPQWGLLGLCGVAGQVAFAPRRTPRHWVLAALGAAAPLYVLALELAGLGRRVQTLPAATERAAMPFGVLVCNVYSSNRDFAAVARLIEDEEPDVVLLLELTTPWVEALAHLDKRYSHHDARPDDGGNFGIGIWSRHAIVRGGIVVPKETPPQRGAHVPQVDVDLDVRSGSVPRRVRFLGVHPLPPVGSANAARRDRLLAWVAEQCLRTPRMPTLVAGDLNASRYCAVALRLAARAGLADATAGLWRSWPSAPALLPMATRIDHVWASHAWTLLDTRRCAPVGSDHFPVLARLALGPGE